jgi:hypothetical protein
MTVSYTRFALFVYPWVAMYPDPDNPEADKCADPVEIPNIVGLSFGRSKSSPSNVLTITIAGPVHWSLRPGNWAVLKSSVLISVTKTASKVSDPQDILNQEAIDPKNGIPRFIGQISAFETTYSSDGDGVIRRMSVIHIREWSDVLNIPVRYDSFSLGAYATSNADSLQLSMITAKTMQKSGFVDSADTIAAAHYNAFEFAQVALRFIGALSADDQDNKKLSELDYNYPEVASRLPTIPKKLFEDLGLEVKNPSAPFATGFVTTLFGVQKNKIAAPGFDTTKDFYGLYPNSIVNRMCKSGSSNEFYERNPPNRPISLGKISLFYTGSPLWQILSTNTDPSINEIFTDFIYTFKYDVTDPTKKTKKLKIGARPTIFMRDKPFTLKKYLKAIQTGFSLNNDVWTVYDDLPRIAVSLEYVTNLALSNTMTTSPNFIFFDFATESTSQDAKLFQRVSSGPVYKKGEMARFGGHEEYIQTTYVDVTPSEGLVAAQVDSDAYFKKLLKVMDLWHTQRWKTADIHLSLKDPGYPLTVGHNLQFTIGNKTLVGHIESISTSAAIGGDGHWSTSTDVRLSRVVQVDPQTQDLDYIPIHEMANLLGASIPFTKDQYDPSIPPPKLLNFSASEFLGKLVDRLTQGIPKLKPPKLF